MDSLTGVDMLVNALPSLFSIQRLFVSVVALIGLSIFIVNLAGISENRKNGQVTSKAQFISLIVGAFMFSLQPIASAVSFTFLGGYYGPDIFKTFSPLAESGNARVFESVVYYINFLGWFWTFRGLYKFHTGARAQNEPSYVGVAIWFLILGMAALNFYVFINAISLSFGGEAIGTKYFKYN